MKRERDFVNVSDRSSRTFPIVSETIMKQSKTELNTNECSRQNVVNVLERIVEKVQIPVSKLKDQLFFYALTYRNTPLKLP